MSYLANLKTEANYTHTLNGAKTHSSTGDACLDFFAVAGGMRYRRPADQIALFERAYIETPDLAMRLLFHLRDIRGGMGERKLFRTLLRHVARTWPESARKNVAYIAEFGRWDDLMCLLGTPAQREAVQAIKIQLAEDEAALKRREAGDEDAHISLLAKWLPSDNTSSPRTRKTAEHLIKALDMERKDYRRLVTGKGKKRIHTETLFPYEVLRPFFDGGYWGSGDAKGADALEALWDCLPGAIGNVNAISVVDVSGSMYCSNGPLMPALISQAMGLYCAERCEGVFHNHMITFESTPHLVKIHGATLRDKLKYIGSLPWGWSTNLEAVFDLILCAVCDADKTVYENARERFEAAGYQMPAVVFHNVNSWQTQTPVTAHTRGTALTSGASTHALGHKFDGNITPMDHMLRVLNAERYAMIHA